MMTSATPLIIKGESNTAHALYLDSPSGRLFAWLHLPASPVGGAIGVVICNPFGYETICAHRGIRDYAEDLAAAGHPVLRFDYIGTGDSADSDEAADQIALWTRDVIAAVEALKRHAGVARVCLLGIRLGSLLATLAAAECSAVEYLALVGPVVIGKRYVRELRMSQMVGSAMSGAAEAPTSPAVSGNAAAILESGGFSLGAATLESLGRIDLQKIALPRVRSVLLLDNDKLPSAARWSEALVQASVNVRYLALPGLIEMAMTAPQFASSPRAMIDATRAWLAEHASIRDTDASAPAVGAGNGTAVPLATEANPLLAIGDDAQAGSITERPLVLPAGVGLFGILTEPAPAASLGRAVILLNPGADYHIGASRMYVSLARRWARSGYTVLRLDFAGIGDSETRAGRSDDEVFPEEAMDDVRVAIDFLRTRLRIADVTAAGLCSGAYHSLQTGVAALDVNRILLLNPQNYFWKKGMSLRDIQLYEVAHNPGLYRQRMLDPRAWMRLFNGQVNLVRIAGIYAHRLRLAAESLLRHGARALKVRGPDDLGWELEQIVKRGIQVSLVFARGDPGIELLHLQAGPKVAQLGERCRLRIIECGDHTFSQRGPRALMEKVMSEELAFSSLGAGDGS